MHQSFAHKLLTNMSCGKLYVVGLVDSRDGEDFQELAQSSFERRPDAGFT